MNNKVPPMTIDETRTKTKNMLNEICGKKGINIEISIFNFSIETSQSNNIPASWNDFRFRKIYLQKCRNILFDLKNDKTLLKDKILNNEIDCKTLGYTTYIERHPNMWLPLIENKRHKDEMRYKSAIESRGID